MALIGAAAAVVVDAATYIVSALLVRRIPVDEPQTITPDALQARTNTTMRSANRAMIVLGAPLGGVLADAVGTATTLAVIAAGFGVVALAMMASPVRQARYADALRE